MELEDVPAANPADDEPVNLDAPETGEAQAEAQPPAGGESDDLDELTKKALGETEANLEAVEVEIDGKTYKVMTANGEPVDPELKFGAMRDADYRQKTMSLSEERKAFQQEQAALRALANLQGDAAMRAQELRAIDAKVRQLSNLDVRDLQQQGYSDEQIREAQAHLQQLTAQRQALVQAVSQDVQGLRAHETQLAQQARQDAIRKAGMEDKALTPERAAELEKFAQSIGFPEEAIQSISLPSEYLTLHYAEIGKQFVERQRKAATMKAAAAGNPAKTLGGRTLGSKDPSSMSMEEYAAWREAGNG